MSAGDSNPYPVGQAGAAESLHDAVAAPHGFYHEEPSTKQVEILRRMTPGQRWDAAHNLYWTVRRHKAAFLKSQHPDWTDQQVSDEVRRIFANART